MKPAPFTYHAPDTVEEAVALLGSLGEDAKALAGGQSLIPLMNFRLAAFEHLVDVGRIDALGGIREENGELVVGAGTRQSAIERSPVVARTAPMLTDATGLIGHFQIRNRGTIGGVLAHADPAAEYPAVAVALGGSLVVAGPAGRRTVAAESFFAGSYTTILASDELIAEVRLPALRPGEGQAIREIARRAGDFALAGCAARLVTEGGQIASARVVLFGVDGRPLRLGPVEQALVAASDPAGAELETALAAATAELEPADDVLASGRYRKSVAVHVAGLAIEDAFAKATGGNGR